MANLMGNTHILINNNSEALERTRLQLLQTVISFAFLFSHMCYR